MIKNFWSINDTKQAYFRSILVNETHILWINCRVTHIPRCFDGKSFMKFLIIYFSIFQIS
jgi:hypothetical protein